MGWIGLLFMECGKMVGAKEKSKRRREMEKVSEVKLVNTEMGKMRWTSYNER